MPPGVARGVQGRVEAAAGQHGRRQEELALPLEQVCELSLQLACSSHEVGNQHSCAWSDQGNDAAPALLPR